jgi:hypothetical protein
MGSSEFLQALLSTKDKAHLSNFSLKTRILLRLFCLLFPNYIALAAKTRLKLKKDISRAVKKRRPDVLIELGSGHSKDYLPSKSKSTTYKLIQIDLENIPNEQHKNYLFIRGDITKARVWNKIINLHSNRGVIIAEGLFSYLSDSEFDFVILKLKKMLRNNFMLITHEPLKPISISRRFISLFIGKTHRRFSSVNQIKEYYASLGIKVKIIHSTEWQAIYLVY